MKRAVAGASALLLSLVGGQALAEPLESGPFRLDWRAPAACPVAFETLARIENLLGAPVWQVLVEPLTARARVRQSGPERFELALETFQGAQRFAREMSAPTCSELTDAAALVLALAIDPKLPERQQATSAVTPPPPSAPEQPSASPVPAPAPQPQLSDRSRRDPAEPPASPRSSRFRSEPAAPPTRKPNSLGWFAGAAGVADVGGIGAFGPGVALAAGLRLKAFEVAIETSYLPSERSYAVRDPDKGGDVELLAVALKPCLTGPEARRNLGLCGLFELGDIRGEGFGTVQRDAKTALWMAAGPALFGRLALFGPLWASARCGVLFPLEELEFTLENVGVVHRVSRVVGRIALGAEAHFD